MTIRFLRDYQGYALGSEVTNLSASQEAAIVATGAAAYAGRAPAYFRLGVDDRVEGFEDDAGNRYGIGREFTVATLPAASTMSGLTAYVSDVGAGIFVRSNGTRWLPINGRALLYEVPATEPTSNTAAETTVISVPLPIGLWSNGDSLQVTARVSKSGSSDTHTFIARIGANALTPLGTNTQWSAGQPATTNRFAMFMFNLKRVSATSVKPGASGAGFASASTTAPTAVTVPNMDTQQAYLQLTSTITGGGGETVTWESARIEWIPAYA